MKSACDGIGFLPVDAEISFDGGIFRPLGGLAGLVAAVDEATNEDGFFYPPDEIKQHARLLDGERNLSSIESWKLEELPKTRRPALLHQLPVSHELLVRAPVGSDFRQADGAFLMHFVGYSFGYRLQFRNWWHDGRIPMKGRRWVHVPQAIHAEVLSTAYNTWRSLSRLQRVRFTNLLYMHCRSETRMGLGAIHD